MYKDLYVHAHSFKHKLGMAFSFEPVNVIVVSIMMGALTAPISLIIALGRIKRGGEKNEETEYAT